jgi:hypothetical protein
MSRDPLGGQLTDPRSLHKYLYAAGDPVDAVDPTGKGFIEWAWNNLTSAVRGVIEGTRAGETALCLLRFVTDILDYAVLGYFTQTPINPVIPAIYGDLRDCLELASLL